MVGRELLVERSGQEERVEEDQAGLMKVAICQFYINAPPTTPARPYIRKSRSVRSTRNRRGQVRD
jgi:hypothetical protein